MAPILDEEVFISVAFTYEGQKANKFVPGPPHWKSTGQLTGQFPPPQTSLAHIISVFHSRQTIHRHES